MEQITVRVETEINPTEAEDKVKMAVANLFGNVPMNVEPSQIGGVLTGEAAGRSALETFRNVLRRDRVRNATRKVLFSGLRGNNIVFFLNKQVAFAGHVSFSQEVAESPLGPISVIVSCENPRELIDWLTAGAP
jgi:predicted RNA binding protein with dsRBD fold (UPF0201 family)